jgi:spore coat-associated protein N
MTPASERALKSPAAATIRPQGAFMTLSRNPKRVLATLAALLGTAGVLIGSGAAFTAKAVNPDNTFTSGALSMSNSEADAAILTSDGLSPGGETTGMVDIQNTGTIGGTMKLSRSALTDSDELNPLSSQLHIVVQDCGNFFAGTPDCEDGDPALYTGTLAQMTSPSELGTFVPGEQHRYRFTIGLSADADNAYQGDSSTATFRWDAYQ